MKFLKFLAVLFIATPALAGVNLKNGNFYISYTDIIVPGGGQDLEITRTYNSKAPVIGWFGFGWGSNYETALMVGPDGAVVVRENGGGAHTRFVPKTPIDPKHASENIIKQMRKVNPISESQAKEYLEKFNNDADVRIAYAQKYGVSVKLAVGTELYSNVRGHQKVIVTKDGYVRTSNNGKKEFFSETGVLTRIENKNGYAIDFKYNKDGLLQSMKDTQAKQLSFEWYPNRRIKSITSTGDLAATYKYDNDDLIESTDIGRNNYKYTYDRDHNLTSVKYADGSKMQIDYERKTQFVSKVTTRNGEVTEYKYGADPKKPNLHYWTEVIKKKKNAQDNVSKYEYELKVRPDGAQYTYRIKTELNGLATETIYNEDSLPLKITRGNLVTNFKYKNGLLTEKTDSTGNIYKLEYDPKFKKISKVTTKDGWTKFAYDAKRGNLSRAESSSGQSVILIYDSKDRILKMVDSAKGKKDKRTLTFKYNAMNKPVEIEMEGVGKINVAYDNYGQIKKVDSKAGQRMALQVTQAFQSLLSIVKPAGINLNM